jgi:ferric-dicitrate binding protein FerR (iron transport regulator)
MARVPDKNTLYEAAGWWTRLRDSSDIAEATEHWLKWTREDDLNLVAFEYIAELASWVSTLDDDTRQHWASEFARRPTSWRQRIK